MRRPAVATPLIGLVIALAGCGTVTYDKAKTENAMRDVLAKQAGLQVQSVRCPDNVKIGTGIVTYCTAMLANGHTVRMAATQRDDKGNVHVGPAEMIADEIQTFVDNALQQRGVSARTICPQHVPINVAQTFLCATRDNAGHQAKVEITITNRSAGFSTRIVG